MTILIYDYYELEERAARHVRVWKICHLTLYVFAAVFGIVNYIFLQHAMELVDDHCVLYPRELEFHYVSLPDRGSTFDIENDTTANVTGIDNSENADTTTIKDLVKPETSAQTTESVQNDGIVSDDKAKTVKRDTKRVNETWNDVETTVVDKNSTIVTGYSQYLVLDTSRSLFGPEIDCQFTEYMPIMSTIFACVWITFFTMCPSGGKPVSGISRLVRPWRILVPALLFALVLVGLTGHSFAKTNGGLHEFCAAFYNITNSTTCSSINPYLEKSWNTSWGMGGRVGATRAASAGVWASWACGAALLLARCLTGQDFAVKRTGVFLTRDPQKKITPHLKRSPRHSRSPRSNVSSPSKQDNASMRSEPTITTELVTASVEQGQDSMPTSLMATPIRKLHDEMPSLTATPIRREPADMIEMMYTPQELRAYDH